MVLRAIIKPTALIGILLSSRRLRNTPGLAFPLRAYKMLMSNIWINIDRTASASTAADPEASRNCADYLRPEYFDLIYTCVCGRRWVCVCVCALVKYSTCLHLALFANILLTKRITTRTHFYDKHLLKRTSSVHSSYGQHRTDRREKRRLQRED